ncbi:MAG: hypothetical protein VYA34_14845 [Myxococcota bacterium]|nr:hypothetical protein [Myxococcota bacterium]
MITTYFLSPELSATVTRNQSSASGRAGAHHYNTAVTYLDMNKYNPLHGSGQKFTLAILMA